jgi:SAM-dependent methyltransferase
MAAKERIITGLRDSYLALQQQLRRRYERRMNVETSGFAYLEERDIADERVFYAPAQPVTTRAALRRLEPGPADVFADLGCGKGVAVLVAGELPFGTVLGVELSEDWAEEARRNIERARPKLRCPDVRIDTADVLEWPVPPDLSVVFLYCPFTGTVFTQALDRLIASYDENPRPLRVVYDYPWEHNTLVGTGRVAVIDVRPARWPGLPRWWLRPEVIVTYEVFGEGESPPRPLPSRAFGHRAALERWSRPNDTRFMLARPGQEPLYSDAETT